MLHDRSIYLIVFNYLIDSISSVVALCHHTHGLDSRFHGVALPDVVPKHSVSTEQRVRRNEQIPDVRTLIDISWLWIYRI